MIQLKNCWVGVKQQSLTQSKTVGSDYLFIASFKSIHSFLLHFAKIFFSEKNIVPLLKAKWPPPYIYYMYMLHIKNKYDLLTSEVAIHIVTVNYFNGNMGSIEEMRDKINVLHLVHSFFLVSYTDEYLYRSNILVTHRQTLSVVCSFQNLLPLYL